MSITAKLLKSRKEIDAELQLSVSKSKVYDNCNLEYYYKYIERLPKKERDFHILGSFAHEVLENFQITLMNNPNLDYYKLMSRCFKWSSKSPEWSEKIKRTTKTINKEDVVIKDEAKRVLSDYLEMIKASTSKVLYVEKPFHLALDNRILVTGYIDLIQKDDDGVLHIADYKTSKDKKYVVKDFFQLKTYAFALFLENPELEKIRTSYIMLRLQSEFITKEFTRDKILPIESVFLDKAKEIQEEKLWRPNPKFLCKFCDFLEHCTSGKDYLRSIGHLPDEYAEYGKVSWKNG